MAGIFVGFILCVLTEKMRRVQWQNAFHTIKEDKKIGQAYTAAKARA